MKIKLFYKLILTLIFPLSILGQNSCDSIVGVYIKKGEFNSLDSLIGLSDLDSGRYEISFKRIIRRCPNEVVDTVMIKEGTTFFFDLNGKIRRVDSFLKDKLISPFYVFDKKQRLKKSYHIGSDGFVTEANFYKKGRLIRVDRTSADYYSRTNFSSTGRIVSNRKFYLNLMYSDSFYSRKGVLKRFEENVPTLKK